MRLLFIRHPHRFKNQRLCYKNKSKFLGFFCVPPQQLYDLKCPENIYIFQPHQKCQTFKWLGIINLSQTFHIKVNDIFVRRSFSYPLCISLWIYLCLCIYIYLDIFILRKWRRKVKILFRFEGFVWDFHCFHSHVTLKRSKLGGQS